MRTTTAWYMLWFDNSGASFEEKRLGAARYFKKKYGVAPNVFIEWVPRPYHYRVEYVPDSSQSA